MSSRASSSWNAASGASCRANAVFSWSKEFCAEVILSAREIPRPAGESAGLGYDVFKNKFSLCHDRIQESPGVLKPWHA